jgi:segregation and condensation protein A
MSIKVPLTKFPLKLLVDVESISKKRVWDVNISELLNQFISLYSDYKRDLRLYGTVALSSSIIYKMQVESFFLFEKQTLRPFEGGEISLPTIIDVPYRHEVYSTSVEDLIIALERIISSSPLKRMKKEETLVPVASLELPTDPFLMNINELIKEFKKQLLLLMDENHTISFRKLVEGLPLIEVVRNFLLTLFVAQEEFVDLIQKDNDIIIKVLV